MGDSRLGDLLAQGGHLWFSVQVVKNVRLSGGGVGLSS